MLVAKTVTCPLSDVPRAETVARPPAPPNSPLPIPCPPLPPNERARTSTGDEPRLCPSTCRLASPPAPPLPVFGEKLERTEPPCSSACEARDDHRAVALRRSLHDERRVTSPPGDSSGAVLHVAAIATDDPGVRAVGANPDAVAISEGRPRHPAFGITAIASDSRPDDPTPSPPSARVKMLSMPASLVPATAVLAEPPSPAAPEARLPPPNPPRASVSSRSEDDDFALVSELVASPPSPATTPAVPPPLPPRAICSRRMLSGASASTTSESSTLPPSLPAPSIVPNDGPPFPPNTSALAEARPPAERAKTEPTVGTPDAPPFPAKGVPCAPAEPPAPAATRTSADAFPSGRALRKRRRGGVASRAAVIQVRDSAAEGRSARCAAGGDGRSGRVARRDRFGSRDGGPAVPRPWPRRGLTALPETPSDLLQPGPCSWHRR